MIEDDTRLLQNNCDGAPDLNERFWFDPTISTECFWSDPTLSIEDKLTITDLVDEEFEKAEKRIRQRHEQ